MKRRYLLPVMIGASAFFHAGLFFLLSVKIPGASQPPARNAAQETFSLVNIALPEPAAPEPPPPPESPPPEPPPPAPVPGNAPAENYIVTEEEVPRETAQGNPVSPAAESAGVTEGAPAAPGRNEAAALTAEYVKRNYNYIQRRIRDKLVYPSTARRAGIQGVTEVSFIIHEDGGISAVTVRTGSGHAVLDEAAVAAVLAAAPFPRPPAPARIAIPISFRLR
jgi:protein TonB